LDSTQNSSGTSQTTGTTGTITVSQANELLIGAFAFVSGTAQHEMTPSAGQLPLGARGNNTATIQMQVYVASASANTSVGGTWNVSANYISLGASFKTVAAGGGGIIASGLNGGLS